MNDLSFFYSAKIAVVFILMFSSTTLEAQQNDIDLMTAIGEHFGGEFNEAEKALELDLNGANSFLERLYRFAISEIVRKNENGEFKCKKSKKPDFQMVIQTILGEDMRNLEKVIPEKFSSDEKYNITSVLSKKFKPNEKVEDLLKELSEKFSEEKLFNLLFSLAARLEALVHGKNIDGTLKEKQKNSKDKIQTFLAVPKCFPESELSIFNYWIEIIEMKTKNSQEPIFGVAIYKEKSDKNKSEDSKERAFRLSKENYKILKQLNDQKFSIYKSSNLLRAAFNKGYSPRIIPRGKIPEIFDNLLKQILSVFHFLNINGNVDKTYKCAFAMFFQNVSESLMKMMSDKGIDPELHLESRDKEIREEVQKDVEENCKTFSNEETKIIFLNNVHYELAINFEFNQRKDIYDRVEELLSNWVGHRGVRSLGILQLSKESYLKRNAFYMRGGIEDFTLNTNRETISIIDALIGKEFNLGLLFDQMKPLVEVTIPKEEANLEKAKEEINKKQLENEIKFLKNNPKSIAEEKYKKAVQIICTIKEYGEKVKMLKSKIKTFEIKEQLNELSSAIQNNEKKYIGPELWKQTKEFCKIEQYQMEKIIYEEELLKDLQFEFNKIWNSSKGVWEGIEKYYLSIPLMQLKEQARTLAKTFEKMLKNVKEHYAQKMDESNVV